MSCCPTFLCGLQYNRHPIRFCSSWTEVQVLQSRVQYWQTGVIFFLSQVYIGHLVFQWYIFVAYPTNCFCRGILAGFCCVTPQVRMPCQWLEGPINLTRITCKKILGWIGRLPFPCSVADTWGVAINRGFSSRPQLCGNQGTGACASHKHAQLALLSSSLARPCWFIRCHGMGLGQAVWIQPIHSHWVISPRAPHCPPPPGCWLQSLSHARHTLPVLQAHTWSVSHQAQAGLTSRVSESAWSFFLT